MIDDGERPVRKRGRPRKPDHLLSRPRKVPKVAQPETPPPPVLEVGDTMSALAMLEKAQQDEINRESKKAELAAARAKHRWTIATNYHRLDDGITKLDFSSRPFLVDIYRDDSQDTSIIGSAQWGKALAHGTLIAIPGGSYAIENLRIGDYVLDPFGGTCRVVGVFPQGVVPLYRVSFADGRHVDACAEHRWEVVGTDRILSTKELSPGMVLPVPDINGMREINPTVSSIEEIGCGAATCISVDHPRHLFVTSNAVVSHNTEMMLCDAAASAGILGLRVLWMVSKIDKRNRFVSSRVSPCFNTVPFYKNLFQAARDRNKGAVDSTSIKHFGLGSIIFVFASSPRELTSWAADLAVVDELTECRQESVSMIPDRLSGSEWGFRLNAGHPSMPGSEQNQNLDYLYELSDAREWYVPCPHCRVPQVLDWWKNCVYEETNKNGAILSVKPRDEDYVPGNNAMDMRPICSMCHRPMNRLSREGFWKPRYPGRAKRGYRLSNICNVNVRIDRMFDRYVAARHKPEVMAEFHNKQLGIPFSMSGTNITEKMINNCTDGEATKVQPYRFIPISQFDWERILAA